MAGDCVLKEGCLSALLPVLSSQNIRRVTAFPEEDGWHIGVLSPDNVCMLDITVDDMVEYTQTGPFTVSIDDLKRVSALKGEVRMTLGPRIVCKAGGARIQIPTEIPEDRCRPFPNLPLDTSFMVSADALRAFIRMADVDTPFCLIEADGSSVTFSAMDESLGRGVSYTFSEEECQFLGGSCRSAYPLSRVVELFKTFPKGASVEVSLGDSVPMMVSVDGPGWHGRCLMAPMILED